MLNLWGPEAEMKSESVKSMLSVPFLVHHLEMWEGAELVRFPRTLASVCGCKVEGMRYKELPHSDSAYAYSPFSQYRNKCISGFSMEITNIEITFPSLTCSLSRGVSWLACSSFGCILDLSEFWMKKRSRWHDQSC